MKILKVRTNPATSRRRICARVVLILILSLDKLLLYFFLKGLSTFKLYF